APAWHAFVTVEAPFPVPADPDDPAPRTRLYTPRTWRLAGVPFRFAGDGGGARHGRAAWVVAAGREILLPAGAGTTRIEAFVRLATGGRVRLGSDATVETLPTPDWSRIEAETGGGAPVRV